MYICTGGRVLSDGFYTRARIGSTTFDVIEFPTSRRVVLRPKVENTVPVDTAFSIKSRWPAHFTQRIDDTASERKGNAPDILAVHNKYHYLYPG